MTNVSPGGPEGFPAAHDRELFAGRYQLRSVLGRGGAATVHQAFDLRLRRQVAIKVFRGDGDADLGRRFADEARLLAGLRHPGLVEIFDFGRTSEGPYLVLELVPRGTLQRRIARQPLPPAQAADVGAALANTLAFIHAAGVVHRDVKPSNVLLDTDERPRLTDFGVSRMLDAARATRTGNVVGTAAYLAPEQVLGNGGEPPADVYALGLVIIESLNGAREYPGPPAEAAVVRLHRPPTIPPGLPPALARCIQQMTADDPDERPSAQDCAAMLGDIVLGSQEQPAPVRDLPVPQLSEAGVLPRTAHTTSTLWLPERPASVPAGEPSSQRRLALSLAAAGILAAVGAAALAIGPAVGGPAATVPAGPRGPRTAPSTIDSPVSRTPTATSVSPSTTGPVTVQPSARPVMVTGETQTDTAPQGKGHGGPGKKKH